MKTIFLSAVAVVAGASSALAGIAPLQPRQSSLPAIEVKGNAFFAGDTRFYVRGVDYQPGGSSKLVDPIADVELCKRDIANFKKLGLNTIRVYTVDNTANHDECMTELANAGIYLVLDVNTPKYSINRADPEISYNDVYLQSVFATVDAFAKYTNTLAFFSGNEVINDGPSSAAAPYVKAVTRDLRQYIGSRGYRKIPVGYSAADVDTNRLQMAQYMNCGSDDERSDFFAFNDYSWCDPSSFQQSGWDVKVKNFTGYGLPLFLSEYGCIKGVYSGGLVYEYSEEGSGYGLVTIDGSSVTENGDFAALSKALSGASNPPDNGGYNATGGASGCPEKDSPNWDVENDALPAIPEPAMKYMTEGAGAGPGLTGPGSQNSGTRSSGTATQGSGQVTSTASSRASGAAGGLVVPEFSWTPVICMSAMLLSTFFGATLL
ncbi:beta-glucanosyltransferase [Endocarpon pusillum]|uniref:1,3-beta-glucanosyltransferase n=1 Tax=Endocarpon pusillum TaxID=364733 RepID=A0A8H7E767_9EURO|nr:beta-glucanosyltransferase [Endocarpon pusillum]